MAVEDIYTLIKKRTHSLYAHFAAQAEIERRRKNFMSNREVQVGHEKPKATNRMYQRPEHLLVEHGQKKNIRKSH